MTIRHVVAWKLAAQDAQTRADQAAEIKRLFEGLVGVVPSLRALEVGMNIRSVVSGRMAVDYEV